MYEQELTWLVHPARIAIRRWAMAQLGRSETVHLCLASISEYTEAVDGSAHYDIFMSYARADAAAAEALRGRLTDAGLRVFLDRYELPAGQPWQPWLEDAL